MWNNLSVEERAEYKKLILAFASLTNAFAQKADNNEPEMLSPIINSKYQETVFQKAFGASAEDIGNTSYDAALCKQHQDGSIEKYLIGIKTFGIASGDQKIAQFKANHDEWSNIIEEMRKNAKDENGKQRNKEEVDKINAPLYKSLARQIAYLRNMRIKSSEANIQGFNISEGDSVKAVYHVLMPSKKGDDPCIYVGETDYTQIDIDNIEILGCTGEKNPTNFEFSDGNHKYKFTSADSQLLMSFDNYNIVKEKWDVKYVDDAYGFFSDLADKIYNDSEEEIVKPVVLSSEKRSEYASSTDHEKTESYSWLITNDNDEVELFSGFNSFFGVGSKMSGDMRKKRISSIKEEFEGEVSSELLGKIIDLLNDYLLTTASNKDERLEKVRIRKEILELVKRSGNNEFQSEITKLLFRPKTELYIPLPNSREFHTQHPDFFAKKIWNSTTNELIKDKNLRKFNLVFEPSGKTIESFITQDFGKAIESFEKQTYLGEWILKEVFQLEDYEPLTEKRLNEVGINGIRLSKDQEGNIHLHFIWIERENLPFDYIG
ncbi:hypothetical protein [Butyrivibrio sp. NC2002]|uniref:hypothetical protein n=1 Tax=Butyrivibrio sp. NC2002 TaxID=1410610 RepID=UPI00055B5BDA|nr:hypothetical protein [Butyrivibrio sp. NC2002]